VLILIPILFLGFSLSTYHWIVYEDTDFDYEINCGLLRMEFVSGSYKFSEAYDVDEEGGKEFLQVLHMPVLHSLNLSMLLYNDRQVEL
jgi:hypothetical protein